MIQRLLKTDYLYTGLGEPVEQGMLAIDHAGRIAAVGQQLEFQGIELEYFPGALCPAFVNTHCHLELSHLKGAVKQKTQLHGFIRELQSVRNTEEAEVLEAIKQADDLMGKNGIAAVGDIANGLSTLEQKKTSSLYYHTFVELFGFDPVQAEQIHARGVELKTNWRENGLAGTVVPHSPYSVSIPLFQKIATTPDNSPLSIHNQETAAENEFFQQGSGALLEMLKGFGLSTELVQAKGKNSLQVYLPLLTKETPLLLVHNTYTEQEDIAWAEENHQQLYWCFCPKANLYIEDRLPNIPQFVAAGVRCTLGTDSLASNTGLSIFDEMLLIKEYFPQVTWSTLLQWATYNGADFLGILGDLGSLEPGKRALVNWLKGEKEAYVEVAPLWS